MKHVITNSTLWKRSRLVCLAFLLVPALAQAEEKRPNIIVIFTDDHGYADIGSQGYLDDLKTPHIDSLAKGGVRVTDGYVTAPQCVPSRAGLLSGLYQNCFGLELNPELRNKPEVARKFAELKTIPERLKEAGYATGMAGKWHLGPNDEISKSHGFDQVLMKASDGGYSNYEGGTPLKKQYHLDACSAAAVDFIETHKDQPFFYYLAYRAPHTPLDAPRKYTDRFPGEMPERRRQALAMISAMDDGVGTILETLRKHGLEEKTLIFFIGDNGAPLKIDLKDEPLNQGGGWDGSLNTPLNGEKGTVLDGGIRTPFLVQWKGTLPAGTVYRHPLISLDVAATAIAVAGLPEADELHGINLMPYLTGKTTAAPQRDLNWRWNGQSAIRSGKWKLVYGGGKSYLFDMESDMAEKSNRIGDHPEVAEKLRAAHNHWARGIGIEPAESQPLGKAGQAYFLWYLEGMRVEAGDQQDDAEAPIRRKRKNP